MVAYTKQELDEAARSIASTLDKCEKALLKSKEGSPQRTLLVRRIKSFRVALDLIDQHR